MDEGIRVHFSFPIQFLVVLILTEFRAPPVSVICSDQEASLGIMQCSPLSLVEDQRCFTLIGREDQEVLLCQHSYTIKNHQKARNPQSRGHYVQKLLSGVLGALNWFSMALECLQSNFSNQTSIFSGEDWDYDRIHISTAYIRATTVFICFQ